MEDRADNLLANDSQAPDRRYEAALAIDADGRFLSVQHDVVDDYGAYFLFAVAGNTNAMAQIDRAVRRSARARTSSRPC